MKMNKIQNIVAICLFLIVVINGCAFDVIHLKQIPTQIVSNGSQKASLRLEKDTTVSMNSGFDRLLKKRTVWIYVGTLSHGDVYKTSDQVLTVEDSHVHQAYIVIRGNKLLGFYLPVEKSYSPISDAVELSLQEIDINL